MDRCPSPGSATEPFQDIICDTNIITYFFFSAIDDLVCYFWLLRVQSQRRSRFDAGNSAKWEDDNGVAKISVLTRPGELS